MAFMMLSRGWKAADVLRTFRTRRDVRPNDAFLTQLADLDNDLRKLREHGIPRKLKLASIVEVDTLPKPFHFEFWQTIPDDLPFQLCHIGERIPVMEIKEPLDELGERRPDPEPVFNTKSEPINILPQPLKSHPHMLLTKVFQTSEERQDVILPSPGKSRTNSYSTTVCLHFAPNKSQSVESNSPSGASNESEWDWEYYSQTEDEEEDPM